MSNQGPFVQPNLRSLLDSERSVTFSNINKVQIGTVQSFNAAKQSVTVQLVLARAVFNTPMPTSVVPQNPTVVPYPLLVDVPIFVLCGGGAFIGMPISAGDTCIVLFNDRDLDPWWTNGTTGAPPNSGRQHSLADGIALVGVRPATQPIAGLPSDGEHIAFRNTSGTLRAALDLLLTALTSWVNTDSTTPNPATVTALNNAKTAIDAILQ